MKILYYDLYTVGRNDVLQCFKELGFEIVLTDYEHENPDFDEMFSEKLHNNLKNGDYDFVFSLNYYPVISRVCESHYSKVKYVSWIWDSPYYSLYSETIWNSCNYIFHFDQYEYRYLKEIGVKNIYYLPLAVNISRLDSIICNDEDKELYSADVSFVGQLYEDSNLYDQIKYLPEWLKGYLEGIMSAQKLIYNYNFLEELLTEPIINEIRKYVNLDLGKTFFATYPSLISNLFLGRKVTSMERIEILDMLSHNLKVNLYSTSMPASLTKVNYKGYIDNGIGMTKVFKQSKINLNITLRTIRTGIPLRVFDIMGAGGFLITNYQQDMYELFEDGKDFITYECFEDLKEKVKYYLNNENERNRISQSGYNKVKEFHTFENRIKKILKLIY